MAKISNTLLTVKKIYDKIIPTGIILQDLDKKYRNLDGYSQIRNISPKIKDVLATFGVLCWMFMIKYLLDFLGVFGEILFFLFIPLSAASHFIGELTEFNADTKKSSSPFPKGRIYEIFLLQIIYLGITFFSFRGFIGHTILANIVAEDIGWATGSPFQYELAVYHLGMGVVGMICIWKRDTIWAGLVISKSIFLFGAAGVHIWDIFANQNFSHGNTGTTLYISDLLLPLSALILLYLHMKHQKKEGKKESL